MKTGDFIRINYVGRLESGEIFDLTDAELAKKEGIFNSKARYAPVAVILGAGMVLPGLEKALQEMKPSDKKEIAVEAKDGFGERDPKLVRIVPAKNFGREAPRPGTIVDFGQARGRVQSVAGGRVRVDFNHPLAGKRLKYSLEVKEKIEGPQNQANAVLEFFAVPAQASVEGDLIKVAGHVVHPLKERISELILKWVHGAKRVDFVESFEKKPEEKK
jgi:FKBP-type peptidyl-prolyl cis-trans isomerase 2